MKNLKTKIFSLLSISILFISCDKDDDNTINNEVKKLPTESIYYYAANDPITTTMKYDDNNRITVVGYTFPTENEIDSAFITYNSDGKIKSIRIKQINEDATYNFSYSGNKVSILNNGYTESYEINEKGYISKIYYGTFVAKSYTYDNNNNATTINWEDEDGSEKGISTFAYDNKIGAFKYINTPMWAFYFIEDNSNIKFPFYRTANNLNKVIQKVNNVVDHESTLTYTYDKDGYPEKGVAVDGEETNNFSFKYILAK